MSIVEWNPDWYRGQLNPFSLERDKHLEVSYFDRNDWYSRLRLLRTRIDNEEHCNNTS